MPYLGKRTLPNSGKALENVGYNALSPHSAELTAAEGELTYSCRKKRNEIRLATWNVMTLNDSRGNVRPERSTGRVAQELQKYNIDITALTETRISDLGTLSERSDGYTFYWQGKPSTEKRESAAGFAIKSDIKLTELPIGHSDRVMTLRLSIGKNRYLHLINAYAPTMQHTEQQRMLSVRSCLIYCTTSLHATKQSSW